MSDETHDTTRTARRRDPAAEERSRAALAEVRTMGDPVLRERAHEVTAFDDDLAKLSERMIALMHDAPGIGLAATQVGVVKRVLVYDVDDGPVTLVNPEIVWHGDETEVIDEGCLSVPGVTVPVERPVAIRVRARDVGGGLQVVVGLDHHLAVVAHHAARG